jgi:uncharacterized repeat protein (TIGR02543 family)
MVFPTLTMAQEDPPPGFPHQFWGVVTINGSPAADGAVVSARIDAVEVAVQLVQAVTAPGQYGWAAEFFVVGTDGDTIDFFVNDIPATSFPYNPAGARNELDLAVETGGVVEYTLTVNSGTGGTVTEPLLAVSTYPAGTVVDLLAVPDIGYQFNNWTGDTGTVGAVSLADTTITMNNDYTITANFDPIIYQLTVNSGTGGTVTEPLLAVSTYPAGTIVDLLAVPDTGYQFVNWTGDAGTVDQVSQADTFITMNDNYEITANFAVEGQTTFYTLTVNSGAGGSVTEPLTAVSSYPAGTLVDLLAVPDTCCDFVNWTGAVGTVDNVNEADTFITMNDDYIINANFDCPEALQLGIMFDEGWNTFATPISLHPCANSWAELIAVSELNLQIVYSYDSSAGAWSPVTGGDEVRPLHGYYVKAITPGEALIIPNPDPTPLPSRILSDGLHLIGTAPASLSDVSVVSALSTVYGFGGDPPGYSLVVSPPLNSPNDWVYERDDPTPPMMSIGEAYWVVMENGYTLYGSSSTPLP